MPGNDNLRVFANYHGRLSYVENWLKRPALNAVLTTYTSSVAAAEGVATNVANKDFEVLGTNMTTALCTFSATGGITLTTAGASADSAIVLPHLSTNQSAWKSTLWVTDSSPSFGAKIVTGASIASTSIWSGFKLTNTPVTATDDDQAFFRLDDATNGGRWQAVYSIAGVDVAYDTGVSSAASTAYSLEISIDAARVPKFFINGDHVCTGTPLITAKNFIPYTGVLANTGAAKAITIRPGYVCALAM